jgi:hypothetical protein
MRPMSNIIIEQLIAGGVPEADARLIGCVASACSDAVSDTPLSKFENHVMLPALAAWLGYLLNWSRQDQKETAEAYAKAGRTDSLPYKSLFDDAFVRKVLTLTDAPDPNPRPDFMQQLLDRVRLEQMPVSEVRQ